MKASEIFHGSFHEVFHESFNGSYESYHELQRKKQVEQEPVWNVLYHKECGFSHVLSAWGILVFNKRLPKAAVCRLPTSCGLSTIADIKTILVLRRCALCPRLTIRRTGGVPSKRVPGIWWCNRACSITRHIIIPISFQYIPMTLTVNVYAACGCSTKCTLVLLTAWKDCTMVSFLVAFVEH